MQDGGGLYIWGGDVLLKNATLLRDNSAPGGRGSNYHFTRGVLIYQLPAPPGHWIAGVECIIFREPCPQSSASSCADLSQVCGRQPNASGCPAIRHVLQPCDWDQRPELLGQTVQVLGFGNGEETYPFVCAAGLHGGTSPGEQAGPQCAGRCEAGTYRENLTQIECGVCERGAYCPEGSATPILCPGGTYGNSTGLMGEAECNSTQPGFFASRGSVEPTPCTAGTVAPHARLERCERCAAGKFQETTGKSECKPCSQGAYCHEGAAAPTPCPNGMYGHRSGLRTQEDCADCPLGSWCSSGQAFPCGIGLVTIEEATKRTSLNACRRCPQDATTRGEGTASMDECVCRDGFLTDPLADELRCVACPPNLNCPEPNTTLADLVVDAEHWRPGFRTGLSRRCPHPAVCGGGKTAAAIYDRWSDATCAPGRGVAGAYCLLCMEPDTHYFDAQATPQRCEPCEGAIGGGVALLVGLALALVLAVLGYRWLATRFESAWRWWRALATRFSFRAKLRVVISFVQIVTQLEPVYVVQYPPAYRTFVGGLGLVNVDPRGWLPSLRLSCLFGLRKLSSHLLVATFIPFGIALAAPIVAVFRGRPVISSLPFVLGWTYLLLPSITSFGFRALAPCDCFELVGGGEQCFLREDYEEQCTGTFLGRAAPASDVLAASSVAIAVWAVGVPLLYATLLHAWSRRGDAELTLALGMLLGDYRPETSAWELVVVAEKLVLTGFLAVFKPGSWMQLFLGTVGALFGFVLQSRVQPYRTLADNFVAYLASLALVPIFLGSLGLQTATLGLSIDSVVLVTILFMFTLLVLVAALLFFLAELRSAREILLVRATRQPPVLTLVEGKRWHLFLSHNWANQDAVATIKRQLQLLLPGVRVFLDVDDLDSIDALEDHVRSSHAVLVLLGSALYFESHNCLRELAATQAQHETLHPICVHEADASKHGSPLAVLRAACPEEHRSFVFGGGPPIVWHRVRDFQLVALAQIAERLVLATLTQVGVAQVDRLPLCISGELAWAQLRFTRPVALYESPLNPSVAVATNELRERFGSGLESAGSLGKGVAWLLMLSVDAFEGDEGKRLAAEVEGALNAGVHPTMLYNPERDAFGAIIKATPTQLKELGLYNPLTYEWRGGAHRGVSVALVARALGARVGVDCGEWVRERAAAGARAIARLCGGGERMRLREFTEQGLIGGGHPSVRAIELHAAAPRASLPQPVSGGPHSGAV